MVFNRRDFMLWATAAPFATSFGPQCNASPAVPLLLSAGQDRASGEWVLAALKPAAASTEARLQTISLDYRGHAVSPHPLKTNTVIVFPRTPGFTTVEADLESGTTRVAYSMADGTQAHGHGVFSADGMWLLTTESDIATGAGWVVVRDSGDYRELARWDSRGIGPHELALMPDGKSVAVANGGLLTRPGTGEKVLNLESMQSNLSYLSLDGGALLEQVEGPHPRASIRHIDVATNGSVALGMQFQRMASDENALIPLTAVHRRGGPMQLLNAGDVVTQALADYVGSVAITGDGAFAGFASPRGDLTVIFDVSTGQLSDHYSLHDVCGLAMGSSRSEFLMTNSGGAVRAVNPAADGIVGYPTLQTSTVRWDNHLTTVHSLPATPSLLLEGAGLLPAI